MGDSVLIPDRDADLAKTFYKRQGRLLLEAGVPATICGPSSAPKLNRVGPHSNPTTYHPGFTSAGASSELGGGVFEDNIGVLPRYPLGVLQLVASNHWGRCKSTSPEEEQSCNDHSSTEARG